MAASDTIIGIDLGTTNSVVAILEGEQPKVIPNSEGGTKTPSVVSFMTNGEIVVGEIARRQGAVNPTRTVYSTKRLMGRTPADAHALGLNLPYPLASTENRTLAIIVGDNYYTPSQISALILQKLKQAAEEYLGEEVTKAIITVPAYFDDLQRQATREAGELAGLEILRLVNEPTAAAMAYGLGKEKNERVAVYDFGGGTFDLTILDITEGTFEVLTSQGDTHLGGDDIDLLVVNLLVERFSNQIGGGYTPDPMAMRRLTEAAEKAKCELSGSRQAMIHLPFLAQINNSPMHLETLITLEEFEALIESLVDQTIECCQAALDDINISTKDVDRVVLVGGTTRIPLVQDMVEDFFGIQAFKGINPDEIVALGAATQAGVMAGKLKEVILLDVTPHSLGIEVSDNRMVRVIDKNTTIPIKSSRLFTTTEDGQEMVVVHVLQGESPKATENRPLGKFTLTGIEPQKAGHVRVQVSFYINSDGMVEVTAEDMRTNQQITMNLALGSESDNLVSAKERAVGRSAGRRKRRKNSSSVREMVVNSASNDVLTGLSVNERRRKSDSSVIRSRNSLSMEPGDAAHANLLSPLPDSEQTGQLSGHSVTEKNEENLGDNLQIKNNLKKSVPLNPLDEVPFAVQHSPTLERMFNDLPTQPVSESASAQLTGSSTSASGLSPRALEALNFMKVKASSPTAREAYSKNFEELRDYCLGNTSDVERMEITIRILIFLGQKTDAQKLFAFYKKEPGTSTLNRQKLDEEYKAAFSSQTGYGADSEIAGTSGEQLAESIRKLELEVADEKGEDNQVEQLIQLYRTRLAHGEDSHIQFKMVKLLVRLHRIDESINILQRLVQTETYRSHALKILGLCFWQKGLHYLAWQKLQQLPPSDDVKDLLYRLAEDMEETDQLLNAKVVLQHLVNIDKDYKNSKERLERLEKMIRMEAGNREAGMTPSIFLTLKDSRFNVMEEINRGSMGIVYRARDMVLGDVVALKILNDYMTGDPNAVERFKREARAAKRLSHPNIVRIHDMFEYGNKKLLSMEYIEGVDLKKVLKERGALQMGEIIGIIKPVCDALGYAHKQSIIHRDIKPANIMITNANEVKVTDFGIAKVLLAGPDATRSGSQIIGTPLYMSPEQILGQQVDARADIYSLGTMLYEMISGKPPFLEGNVDYHHLHSTPPELPETADPRLVEIVLKCLEKKPEDRYATTDELSQALDALGVIDKKVPDVV